MTFGRPTIAQRQALRAAERARNLEGLCTPSRSLHRGSYAGETGAAAPKRPEIRSQKLLKLVRKLPCMASGVEGRTQAAHSNWPQHGKGGARKADDNRVAALSAEWHREIDQGSTLSADQRQRVWWLAHQRTVQRLLDDGLWPEGVPVPQIEDFWRP